MQAQLAAGTLESYATLRSANKVVQFDLTTFINDGNLNTNKYFIQKRVPMPELPPRR
jgi:hypothetical protein